MKKSSSCSSFISRGFCFAVVIACLVAATVLLSYPARSEDKSAVVSEVSRATEPIKIVNNVPGLDVVSSKEDQGRFVVTVQNNFDKTINGFYMTTGEVGYLTELIYSDQTDGVAPEMKYDVPSDLDSNLRKNGLVIRAVVFENGNGAGEERFVREMLEKRAGEKLALTRGQTLLAQVLKSNSKINRRESLLRIRDEYAGSEIEADGNQSIKLGMHSGKERFLRNLEALLVKSEKDASFDLDDGLRHLSSNLQKFTSKL